jgi:hypothetical protein
MSINTKKNTVETLDKKAKIELLKNYHKKTFSKLGVTNPAYSPKMAYYDAGERVISFFPSEVEKGEDIFTEFVSRDYDSEDDERTLYKWKYNPHYATEYRVTAPHSANHTIRYIIPVEELIDCTNTTVAVVDEEEFDMPNPDQDLPIDQLTIRDLAAILTGKPVSMKKWLNEIVKK